MGTSSATLAARAARPRFIRLPQPADRAARATASGRTRIGLRQGRFAGCADRLPESARHILNPAGRPAWRSRLLQHRAARVLQRRDLRHRDAHPTCTSLTTQRTPGADQAVPWMASRSFHELTWPRNVTRSPSTSTFTSCASRTARRLRRPRVPNSPDSFSSAGRFKRLIQRKWAAHARPRPAFPTPGETHERTYSLRIAGRSAPVTREALLQLAPLQAAGQSFIDPSDWTASARECPGQ